MDNKISPELARFLTEPKRHPKARVPVIVTLAPDAKPAGLEQAGLNIERRFELIPAVAGTIAASDIPALARLDAVELIELDSEMQAQSSSLGLHN
jgi:hypothetical protein